MYRNVPEGQCQRPVRLGVLRPLHFRLQAVVSLTSDDFLEVITTTMRTNAPAVALKSSQQNKHRRYCNTYNQPSLLNHHNNNKVMSRGDKRERDREKNLAKQQAKNKAKEKVRCVGRNITIRRDLLGLIVLWARARARAEG